MAYARRTDANHVQVAAAFRKLGCKVLDLSRQGKGCPDLLIRLGSVFHLVEVKTPTGRTNALQDAFRQDWPVSIVRDLAGVETVVRMLRGESM